MALSAVLSKNNASFVCMCGSRGGNRGSSPPDHKNIEFSSNTGLDPLKNRKATKQAFNVGPSSTPQRKARMATHSGTWILSPLIN